MGRINKYCFIDTSAFISLNHAADQNYEAAVHIASKLNGYKFIVSEAVITETYNILRYRLGFNHSRTFLKTVLNGNEYEIINVTTTMRLDVSMLLEKFSEHKISYCDALSMIIMREKKISHIFAFDHHFEMMGARLINYEFINEKN